MKNLLIPKFLFEQTAYQIKALTISISGVEAAITRTQTVLIDVETDEVISYNSEFIEWVAPHGNYSSVI